jgi:hypothetical protein
MFWLIPWTQTRMMRKMRYGLITNQFNTDSKIFQHELEPEPVMPLVITTDRISIRRPSLRALHVTYGPIPYYPDTHPDGHLYVHYLKNEKRLPKEIFDDVSVEKQK